MSNRSVVAPNYTGPRLLGAPVGDFSFAQTLLITVAAGFLSFFAATFLAIVTILFLTQALHRTVNFADAYKFVGLPVGIVVMVAAGVYLGTLLLRRVTRRG